MNTPTPQGDPQAVRAALLNDLTLWLSDSIIMARRVIEGHFGVSPKAPAPHELEAIVKAGTALFQAAVMIQAQQQALQQAMQHSAKQASVFEPPPKLRKALNDMMKKAPQIIDEMLKETREGEEWKQKPDEDEPPPPPKRRRHPEDEPEENPS
jgi:hypothetical protein